MFRKLVIGVIGLGVAGTTVGCQTKAGTGALVGGAAGAGIGAIIGNNSRGRTASGAAIGGAVGAVAGGLIGNEQDKADARERERYEHESRSYGRDDGSYDRSAPPPPPREYERYERSTGTDPRYDEGY